MEFVAFDQFYGFLFLEILAFVVVTFMLKLSLINSKLFSKRLEIGVLIEVCTFNSL